MDFHGIILLRDFAAPFETIEVGGLEQSDRIADVGPVYSDYCANNAFRAVAGRIKEVRAVLGQADCRSDSDRALLDVAKGEPFVRASATIFSPLVLALFQEDRQCLCWFAEGLVMEKRDNHILRYTLRAVAIQMVRRPGQHQYRMFPGSGL